MRLRVSTWNIGGGRTLGLKGVYDTLELEYFCSELARVGSDLVCLQEAHIGGNKKRGQVAEIAKSLSLPFSLFQPMSVSHLDESCLAGIGVVTRFPLLSWCYTPLPNPHLFAPGPDGRAWRTLDKGFLRVILETEGGPIALITGHSFPFHHFGRSANEPSFRDVNRTLENLIVEAEASFPTVLAGDLNVAILEDILPIVGKLGFRNGLPLGPTNPENERRDHIYFSKKFTFVEGEIVPGLADHYLCWSTLSLRTDS